jgi:hypothetical protein
MARRYVGTVASGGMIALIAILLLAPQAYSQNIGVVRKKFTISGTIGLSGVSLTGFPTTDGAPPTTDENGAYSVEVEYGWTGTIRPVKIGYEFLPSQRSYTTRVTAPLSDQDYTPTLLTYTISGTVGQSGVRLGGFPIEVISGPDGRYSATVDYGWSGIVTPDKMGFRFEPPSSSYNQVIRNVQQDYKPVEVMFTISGSAGVPGITMQGLPGNPVTGPNGRYSVEVRYGAPIKVVPTKEGHLFTPEYREYPMVLEPQLNQDYDVKILSYDISGSTGLPRVVMKGFPQDIVTDDNGFYSVTVNHGWGGKVTPEKPGYTFQPEFREYKKVTESFMGHDYNGNVIYLKIEGTAGIGAVELFGFPQGVVTSDEKGFFRTQVEYGWTGVVTPQKEGYSFTPLERPFNAITGDQLNQNFKAEKVYFEISGNVGQPGVTLRGLPGSVVSKADGSYSARVDYSWDGTVTPIKAGFTFDPTEQRYMGVLSPMPNQNYTARIVQHTITGKVVDKKGSGISDVLIVADGPVEPVTTDFDGVFELKVDHGWRGKITPQKEGWNFTPAVKPFDAMVTAPIANQLLTGEIKMMKITNVLKAGPEPIQGVEITAEPGGHKAVTDAKGKWVLEVPYGWSGALSFFKEEFEFEGTVEYVNVTEDIDETAPKKPATPPPSTTRPPTTTTTPPSPTTTATATPPPTTTPPPPTTTTATAAQPPTTTEAPPTTTISTGRELLLRRIDQVKKQLDVLLSQAGALDATGLAEMNALIKELNQLDLLMKGGGELPADAGTSYVRPTGLDLVPDRAAPRLLSVLTELSRLASTAIAVDMTVKDGPVAAGVTSVQGLPLELALKQILDGASRTYTFRRNPDGTYLVFHPISNTFPPGSDLLMALGDIATEAGVSIMTDPNVGGRTSASFENYPLEDALEMVLAATPYVFKAMKDYYIVADRSPANVVLTDISETRFLRLNHGVPQRIKELLPMQYQRYVQAEAPSTTDPNDQGHLMTVTAPKRIADDIMRIIRKFDLPRRQVLLDTRVVVMERGNLLNLGVEWNFPSLQYGRFYDGADWLTGLSLGYSPDQTFTNSLMATLNMLQSTNQADIVSNPQLIAQDGKQASLKSIQEEWFMMSDRQGAAGDLFGFSRAELEKIESGTILTITPRIGDSNEITLEMAVEVSDSIPKGRASDLPIVTRRQAKNSVTVQNGGTVAVAGLTENRTRQMDRRVPFFGNLPIIGRAFRNNEDDKATREIAVFVTATLVPEISGAGANRPTLPGGPAISTQPKPAGQDFTDAIRESLRNQPR